MVILVASFKQYLEEGKRFNETHFIISRSRVVKRESLIFLILQQTLPKYQKQIKQKRKSRYTNLRLFICPAMITTSK